MSSLFRILGSVCLVAVALSAAPLAAQQSSINSPASDFDGRYGGVHEMGVSFGHAWQGGNVLGYVRNTHYTDVVVRYSYDLVRYPLWTFRWSPEFTLLADLYEPAPSPGNIHSGVPLSSYGAGISPGGMQGVFFPKSRVQPFLNFDAGFVLYNQPVLADGGTKFMFTVDAGLGANVFVARHDAINVGYRYQHQSNADIGLHNPGADSKVFTFGVSHFFNPKPRR